MFKKQVEYGRKNYRGLSPDFSNALAYDEARKIEKAGDIKNAKKAYLNIAMASREFYGAHQRLAIIFRREKDLEAELQIICHALWLVAYYWNAEADTITANVDWPESPNVEKRNRQNRARVLERWRKRLDYIIKQLGKNV